MSKSATHPKLFVEVTCLSSPHPERRLTLEVPRIILANTPFNVYGSFGNQEIKTNGSFPRIRELEFLIKYKNYDVKLSENKKYFVSFKNVAFKDREEFLRHAKNEMSRVNRVLGTVLPHAAKIFVEDVVYIAESPTQMRECWRDSKPLGETTPFSAVNEQELINRWNLFMEKVLEDPSEYVFSLLDKDGIDPILTTCTQLISEDTFPALYNAFEILLKHYGGHHKFIKLGILNEKQLKRFKDNAQVYRHAEHKLNTEVMHLMEAKIILVSVLRYYMKNPHGVRR